ncbi:hypothetical protein ACSBR1_026822 [Camellia fascicularis]
MSQTILICFEKAIYHGPGLSPRQFGLEENFECTLKDTLGEIKTILGWAKVDRPNPSTTSTFEILAQTSRVQHPLPPTFVYNEGSNPTTTSTFEIHAQTNLSQHTLSPTFVYNEGEESLSLDGLGLPSKLRCHCWGRFATSLDDLIPGSTTPNSTAAIFGDALQHNSQPSLDDLAPGSMTPNSTVQNLFHSVQLNVNNPQFVIMQGRITKVLNMKPPEILSMLEEAALKTLEKKQSKVDEIDKLLGQEILPALEKLKKERMQYMQWSDGNAELYRLKRFCVAFEYVQAEKIRDSAVHNVEELKGKIYEIDDKADRMCMEIREMETKVSKLTVEREDSMGGEVKSLLEKVDVLAHDLVREFVRSIEELKKSIEEKAYVVKNAEDGAAHQKKRLEQLDNWNRCAICKSSGNQLRHAKVAVGSAEIELIQLKTKISHSEKELKEKANQLLSKREEAVVVENELDARTKDVENVKLALESLLYEEGQMEALQKDRAAELELVQKGKLFNIIVDTENTRKQLLQNGDLRRRKVIILHFQVGKGNAEVALSLVGYDQELKRAMEYVFGSTFVCKTIDATREKNWHPTLEGDIFQPSGLLTGGSCKGGGDLLRQLHALAEVESKLSIHQKRLSEIEAEDLKAQLELKSYDLSLFQSRAEQNEHLEFCELVKRIEQELLEAKSAANEKQLLYEECITTVSLLEKSICENTNNWDVKLKDLEKKMGKAQVQSASKDLEEHANEKERLLMEMEAVKQECASLESQFLSSSRLTIASIRNAHDQAQSELNLFRSKMKECDTQISCIPGEQQELQHKLSGTNLERKKMENEVKRMEMEQKSCSLKVKKLIEKHAWITLEKHRFGRSGTDYDFASRDPHTAREDFEKLQAEQSEFNKKAMAMFEISEDEYNDLISKKNIIENDKTKIKIVIEELDEKKKEMLKVTWVKVNNDFGSIFSTLLPGPMAKLEMPEGSSFLDGLEVCVAFGSVWKQSLSKLSGGQRSVLALSLILALLLLKPAPLYILDEVDAALDLSHTQNIGRIIKTHFPHSQFIVVSLKEGMFNNANVLFRTMFVDGVSTVQRTVASKPDSYSMRINLKLVIALLNMYYLLRVECSFLTNKFESYDMTCNLDSFMKFRNLSLTFICAVYEYKLHGHLQWFQNACLTGSIECLLDWNACFDDRNNF